MARENFVYFTKHDLLAETEFAPLDTVTAGTGDESKAVILSSAGKWTYGTTATPITSATASSEFFAWRTACSATSGNSYGTRFNHKITGAGGAGAAVRGYGYAYGVAAANVYGGEFTAEEHSTSGSAVTGLLAGIRSVASLQIAQTGTVCALDLEFDVKTGITASDTASAFIRVANVGEGTGTTALLDINTTIATDTPTALVSTHADHAATHLIRILINGTPFWLLAANAH